MSEIENEPHRHRFQPSGNWVDTPHENWEECALCEGGETYHIGGGEWDIHEALMFYASGQTDGGEMARRVLDGRPARPRNKTKS